MGILRLIFALAVVFGHSWLGGPVFVGGKNAVQLFYMISGFLISYVLVEAKSYATVVDFYKSRALRIYPVYAVVAVITLLAMFILGNSVFLDVYRNAPVTAGAFLAATNVFVLGQDWVMFLGVTGGKLVATGDFSDSEVLLYNGLLVPQAWTLGVELSFYALAPFVLRQRRRLFAMFALSVCVRLVLVAMGIASEDPWRYRFFAAELSLFLLGALAHQFLLPMYLTLPAKRLSQASLSR